MNEGWTFIELARSGELTGKARAYVESLQQRIADLERQNELLRAVAEAAILFIDESVCDPDITEGMITAYAIYVPAKQAAIDGGALGCDE